MAYMHFKKDQNVDSVLYGGTINAHTLIQFYTQYMYLTI
mgnify:CR=1 FL=1